MLLLKKTTKIIHKEFNSLCSSLEGGFREFWGSKGTYAQAQLMLHLLGK